MTLSRDKKPVEMQELTQLLENEPYKMTVQQLMDVHAELIFAKNELVRLKEDGDPLWETQCFEKNKKDFCGIENDKAEADFKMLSQTRATIIAKLEIIDKRLTIVNKQLETNAFPGFRMSTFKSSQYHPATSESHHKPCDKKPWYKRPFQR